MSALFEALVEERGPCALLESTLRGPLGRLSLLARRPLAVLVAEDDQAQVTSAHGTRTWSLPPIGALRELLRHVPRGTWPDEGAVVAALAYDFARPGGRRAPTPLLVALAVERLEIETHAAEEPPAPPARPRRDPRVLAEWSSLTRDEYLRRAARILEHIAAGDIYQANLSQRFERPFARTGLDLYRHLRRVSPAPFAGYLRAGGLELASASPERLLRAGRGRLATRPIAGTRPRALDPRADAELQAELILSEKERAEHLMLVDLARNDLGRVARLGSVRVDELMSVESYAHVRHIVSNVSARLAPGHDALDALLALFPAGTISGVPKRRCLQILDALEPVPRGFYTGTLFYLTPAGRLDANILIRSAVVAGGRLTFHTGGGIVADSEPEREYQETLDKAAGLHLACESALGEPPAR